MHNFKMVQIVNSKVAEIVKDFTWPVYHEGPQDIFFSEDKALMYEALKDSRVFLYTWVGETAGGYTGAYNFLTRMVKFPTIFQSMHDWNVILSPDFAMYVDIDTEIDRFVIKDCMTQNHIYTIPKEVMWHEGSLDIKQIFNRF